MKSSFLQSAQNLNIIDGLFDAVKSSCVSSIDELEDFAMGRVRNKAGERSHVRTSERVVKPSATKSSRYNEAEDASLHNLQNGGDDLESFFSVGPRSNSVPRSRATNFVRTIDVTNMTCCFTMILYHLLIHLHFRTLRLMHQFTREVLKCPRGCLLRSQPA